MTDDDMPGVRAVRTAAFVPLVVQMGLPRPPELTAEEAAASDDRFRALRAADAGGCWIAERDGRVAGATMSILRESLWGLSLLVVDPDSQSAGLGRALMDRAMAYGASATAGIICASPDHRALRRYRSAGFVLHPGISARGPVARQAIPAGLPVRDGTADDFEWMHELGRVLRGAAYGPDLQWLLDRAQLIVHTGRRGFAFVADGADVVLCAGLHQSAAQAVLWEALARTGEDASLHHLTAEQDWAVEVAVAARLRLAIEGAVCFRGAISVPAPYVPHGLLF